MASNITSTLQTTTATDTTSLVTETVTYNDSFQTTEAQRKPDPGLQLAYSIIIPAVTAFIMFAMGCDITPLEVWKRLRRPVAPLIGGLCQFILLPLLLFGISFALDNNYQRFGLVLCGTCPGGVASNIFTYWSGGDLPLSVTMTTCSSILAIFFMPFNLWLYTEVLSKIAGGRRAVIPYWLMAMSLVVLLVPLSIGMLMRWRFPKHAPKVLKLGSIFGFAVIVFAGIIQRYLYPSIFELPIRIWILMASVPLMGGVMGFGFGAITRGGLRVMRTIAWETSLQNMGVAITLITLTFGTGRNGARYIQIPLLYAIFQMTWGFIISMIHRIYYRVQAKRFRQLKLDEDAGLKEKTTDANPFLKPMPKERDATVAVDEGVKDLNMTQLPPKY